MPENVLNEYTSPDIRLFKEKQEIGDGIECFGGGFHKRLMDYAEVQWPSAEDLIRVFLIKNENEEKNGLAKYS